LSKTAPVEREGEKYGKGGRNKIKLRAEVKGRVEIEVSMRSQKIF
jgi:hypothetical protein